MAFIGNNIRKIRSVKGLSQAAFAEVFDLKRANIGAYEEGRAEPRIEVVARIANHFSISLEDFIGKELRVNAITRFRLFEQDGTQVKGKKRITPVHVSGESVPYVSNTSIYIGNRTDKEYLGSLGDISVPGLSQKLDIAFAVQNNDMLYMEAGIRQGDTVFCSELKVKRYNPQGVYVFIINDTFYIRRIGRASKGLQLDPDNPQADVLNVMAKEVQASWKVEGVLSSYISQAKINDRITKLETLITEISRK